MRRILFMAVLGSLAFGCSSARDVEVSGEVSAPASAGVQGRILLDFLDVVDSEEVPESVYTQTLDAPGAFTATAPLEGDKVRIRAINDRDNDGACTAGEAWAEVDAEITDDKVSNVQLVLANAACPAAAAM
jgi:hypothetical protein